MKIRQRGTYGLLRVFALLLALGGEAVAQQEAGTEDLAKKTQNPVADLISVPQENNFN